MRCVWAGINVMLNPLRPTVVFTENNFRLLSFSLPSLNDNPEKQMKAPQARTTCSKESFFGRFFREHPEHKQLHPDLADYDNEETMASSLAFDNAAVAVYNVFDEAVEKMDDNVDISILIFQNAGRQHTKIENFQLSYFKVMEKYEFVKETPCCTFGILATSTDPIWMLPKAKQLGVTPNAAIRVKGFSFRRRMAHCLLLVILNNTVAFKLIPNQNSVISNKSAIIQENKIRTYKSKKDALAT